MRPIYVVYYSFEQCSFGGRILRSKQKSFRIAPDGHWQARPFTDRFGSSEADVLYQFPLAQGGTNAAVTNTMSPRIVRRHGSPKRCEPGKGAGSMRGGPKIQNKNP